MVREEAEALAIQALSFVAAEPERLGRFLAVSGIGPAEIRAVAREPYFLAGIIEHLSSDERLVLAFCAQAGLDPAEIARARELLVGKPLGESEAS
jgi:hypothetical protein